MSNLSPPLIDDLIELAFLAGAQINLARAISEGEKIIAIEGPFEVEMLPGKGDDFDPSTFLIILKDIVPCIAKKRPRAHNDNRSDDQLHPTVEGEELKRLRLKKPAATGQPTSLGNL